MLAPESKLCTSPKSLDFLTKAMMQLISTLGRDISWGSLIWLMLCTYQSDWLESSPPGRMADPYGETESYDRR
ncbi:hypothetical protein IG631_09549 [Alternaria alternata]|nr:hypothetical protein IG631_09549 [Alternaria alternata]